MMVKKILFIYLVVGILFSSKLQAQATCPLDTLKPQQVASLETLKQIPILNQGRIKPFDTYARNFLLQMSGKQRYQKENASQWMARFFFAPRTTFKDKIFLINNPEILEAIKVEPDKSRRYSYHQLEPGLDKLKELVDVIKGIDEKNQSIVDKELGRVYGNLVFYIRLSGAFAFALPHPDFTISSTQLIEKLHLNPDSNQNYSFFDILNQSDDLEKLSKSMQSKNQALWNDEEKSIVNLMSSLSFWTEHYANCPLGIIPTENRGDEEWISPMDAVLEGFFNPVYYGEIKNLKNLALSYWNGSQLEFDMSARAFRDSVYKRISLKEQKSAGKISLELVYNKLNLFLWAKLFYAIGIILFLCSLLAEKKWMYRAVIVTTLLAFIPHVLALVFRVLIMSRPPVSNLFETFIFVGVISAALGLIMELINKNWLGLVVTNISGLILLMISAKFSSEGDTMQILVAVLNSNFWLSTHVIAITTGYAGCCVAGVMGHIYIIQVLTQSQNKHRLENTFNNMLGILGFGLTLAFLGTALGGIWADQSWGRFWGWDPKENGALMIVLWSALVIHARLARVINPLGVAVGCILGIINVMWAWFGVNLLSIGLHSYGFTSGIANTLILYVVLEVIFISTTVIILGKRNIKF